MFFTVADPARVQSLAVKTGTLSGISYDTYCSCGPTIKSKQ